MGLWELEFIHKYIITIILKMMNKIKYSAGEILPQIIPNKSAFVRGHL